MGKCGIKRTGSVLISGLLILSEILSFAGCKNQGEVKKVSKDSTWYDSSTIKIDEKYSSMKLTECESDILGFHNDGIVLKVMGEYELPDDFDWEKDNYEDYRFINVDYYDLNGELISSVDVSKIVSSDDMRIDDVFISSDGVCLKILDTDNGEEKHYLAKLDLNTGAAGELEEIKDNSSKLALSSDMIFERSWNIGGYSVSAYSTASSYAFVISNGSDSKLTDLSVELPFTSIAYISNYITVSDTEILLVCLSNDVKFVSLNLETGEVQNKDEEYSWLNQVDYTTGISVIDGKNYISDQSGIRCINFATKELEEILSFNCCNLNRYATGKLKLISVKDDRYVLAGMVSYEDSLNMSNRGSRKIPTIAVLEKKDSNPNAGKIILTAAAAGRTDISYPVCEAIRIFNDTNGKYYIQLDNKFNLADFIDYSNAETDDEIMSIYYSGFSELSSQLATEMLSGNGPDIVLNAADFRLIQSEDYLVDLSSFIKGKNGINAEGYFSNVIDAAKVDDKLLYMPVSFTVSGISTEKSYVRAGQTGFTFDEYIRFKDEVCNGFDPMDDSQIGVLCTLYSYMGDTCINGKNVNFDNESFRALCDYVKNNVYENSGKGNNAAESTWYPYFGQFLMMYESMAPDMTLLGYPSTDGRGPVISVETSIGISASASSAVADGAWEFIRLCMGEDIQELISRDASNPMSTGVYDMAASKTVENYNKANPSKPVDAGVAASYKDVLLSASVIDNMDPAILVVLREEVPPYLLDQKSFDEVIKILQNRVTTIIAERT